MSLKRSYLLIALLIVLGIPVLAIMSCQAPPPTSAPEPLSTAPPPPIATSPPRPPATATAVPPTAVPTAVPTKEGSEGSPLAMFLTADFAGSGNCSLCHDYLFDESRNDVSIAKHWRSAMMANAARDPYYLAKVSAEVQHNPLLKDVLEATCARCHMPMASEQAAVDGEPVAMFGTGFLNPTNDLHEAALDGVSCTLCHQIEDEALGTTESFSGNFVIDTSTDAPERKAHGPFDDPYEANMRALVQFIPLLGEQTLDGALCGSCHTLFTPVLDDAGNLVGEFPEQTPLLEWQHSAYPNLGTVCQSCHMPEADGAVAISNRPNPPKIQLREPYVQHHFVGGNAFMISLLQANVDELQLTCSTENLEDTAERVNTMLSEKSVAMAVTDARVAGDALSLTLRLTNMAGHKFPGGFPARRAWLHFEVTDGSGQVVFESGKPRVDGSIVGADADVDRTAYEKHHDVVSEPEQVQMYEPVMYSLEGDVTYTLLEAASYIKDNRITPLGFDKRTAGENFAVQGLAAVDEDFVGGSDDVTYQINTQGHSGPFNVTVELLYQSIAYPFIRDIQQYDTPSVAEFLGFYEQADKLPVVVASLQQTLQ